MNCNKKHLDPIALLILAITLLTGCSDSTRPDMLEPIIQLSEATDIARTEATMTACIDMRGSSGMAYLTLFYKESNSETAQKIIGNPEMSESTFHLTGLKPGCQYSCHLEGGTETATLSSNSVSFTTMPNELPRLSSASTLSTGPTGIIIEFSIIEDGGEPILTAGCEVRTSGTYESRQIYLKEENLSEGKWQISINGLTPLTTYTITPFASNSIGEAQGAPLEYTTKNSILLQQPGQLATLLSSTTGIDIEPLTISGFMNGDDFLALRSILGAPVISEGNPYGIKTENIDLTDAVVTEGGDSYDGSRFTVADEISTNIFADCKLLRRVVLPNSANKIARNAFARCNALKEITISAGTEQILPSADCNSLERIDVSKANTLFSSIDGVLLNKAETDIVCFPCGKTGEYQHPTTITSIGENAFSGSSITSLLIPPSVTSIGRGAFAGSALKEIVLPDKLTGIYEGMFQNCHSLTTLYLGSATEFIGDFAFDESDISDIFLPATIPPVATANAFVNHKKPMAENCTLHVPKGTKKAYTNHSKWGIFNKIEEY